LALEATRDIEDLFRIISVAEVIFVRASVNPEIAIPAWPTPATSRLNAGLSSVLAPGPP